MSNALQEEIAHLRDVDLDAVEQEVAILRHDVANLREMVAAATVLAVELIAERSGKTIEEVYIDLRIEQPEVTGSANV